MRVGAAYSPTDELKIVSELHKEDNFDLIYRMGIEIEIFKGQFFRTGLSNNPSNFSFGFGMLSKGMKVDYGVSTHQYLGTTQNLSVGFDF